MTPIIVLLVLLASAVACHFIAKKQHTSPAFWGFMGALFGPFAIPFCLMTHGDAKRSDLDEEED